MYQMNLYYANMMNLEKDEDLKVPPMRHQKSQGTFRVQNIESEFGEQNISEMHIQGISQFSEDSGGGKNDSYLSNRDGAVSDEPHPFNGPKLHQFRKG